MIVLAIMAVAAGALLLAGRFYAPVIGRVLGDREDRTTPAVAINDGRDYVPTKTITNALKTYLTTGELPLLPQ